MTFTKIAIRIILDVECTKSSTYRSLVHHFGLTPIEIGFEHAGKPLSGSEIVGRRAISPRKSISSVLREMSVVIQCPDRSQEKLSLRDDPTVGTVCSLYASRFASDAIIELTHQGKSLDRNASIFAVNPELEVMQLRVAKPAAKAFRFTFQGNSITTQSTSGRLSSMIDQFKSHVADRPDVVERDGNRIADDALLDPNVTYTLALLPTQLTVTLLPVGVETNPRVMQIDAKANLRLLRYSLLSECRTLKGFLFFGKANQ
jgi:hypothetical protein